MNEASPQAAGSGKSEAWFAPLVAGLLVVIVAAMAVLWMKERHGRLAAEKKLAEASRQRSLPAGLAALLEAQGAEALKQAMPPGDSGARPVQREDLPRQTMEIDGRPRPVLQISPQAGERLGFQPGDVILVGQVPASLPGAP